MKREEIIEHIVKITNITDEMVKDAETIEQVMPKFLEFIGNDVLVVKNLSKTIDGVKVLDNVTFTMTKEDKIAFVGENSNGISALFAILSGEMEADSGEFKWGQTVTSSYFPRENIQFFQGDLDLTDWLRQYSREKEDAFATDILGDYLTLSSDSSSMLMMASASKAP
jgi:ATPase subunit of ABC transporter with duplicated ATPase domains